MIRPPGCACRIRWKSSQLQGDKTPKPTIDLFPLQVEPSCCGRTPDSVWVSVLVSLLASFHAFRATSMIDDRQPSGRRDLQRFSATGREPDLEAEAAL